MEKKHKIIKTSDLAILGIFLLVMMVVGSIWDYPVSLALHNQKNWFGIFFAAYGEISAVLGLVFAGTLLFLGRNKKKIAIAIFQILGSLFFVAIGVLGICFMPREYLEFNNILIAVIGIVLAAGAVVLAVSLSRNADRGTMVKVAAVFLVVIVFEMVLVNIVKIPWGRPRMRLIAENPEAFFTPWWVVGSDIKDALMAKGVASNEFKSFPSGHTANGAAMILIVLFATLSEKLKNSQTLLFFIGAGWGVLVAISRIIMGAHFITDTVVGFVISLVTIIIMIQLVFKNENKLAYRQDSEKQKA